MSGRKTSAPSINPPSPTVKESSEAPAIKVVGITFFEDFGRAVNGGSEEIQARKKDNGFNTNFKGLAIETSTVEASQKIKEQISDGKKLKKATNLQKDPIIKGKYIILKPDLSNREMWEATSDILAFLKKQDLLSNVVSVDPKSADGIAQRIVQDVHKGGQRNADSLQSIRFGAKPDNSGPALVFV